ncbi:hypothetical protein [Pseudomonas mohnii]
MENVELFACLDIDNPMVAWEVAVGRIKSYCDRNPDNIGLSVSQYSMLRSLSINGAGSKIKHEFNLEVYRQKKFSDNVSRLSGVYFFESEAIAHQALDRWGMSHKKQYISKVNFSAEKLTRYDSEWITAHMKGEHSDWYEGYLSGETLGVRPLTEIVASGIGLVRNNQLREQAYKRILERWPTSTPLLALATAAFCEAGIEDVALLRPFLMLRDGELYGQHIVYMKSLEVHQKEIGEAVLRLKREGTLPRVVMPDDKEAFFSLPDFKEYSFKLSMPEAASVYRSMHEY